MSLKPELVPPIPEETKRIAKDSFPKGNTYMRMRDELGTFYQDEQFASLFPPQGQPAESPWRLALICVMQFAENLSDRQAADAVRARIDWKYALSLKVTDSGFDFSVLSEFRTRLLDGGMEQELLDTMLTIFQEHGLLKQRGKQRTDSSHVLAAVRRLNRLESVGETLRATLNSLAVASPEWLAQIAHPDWFDRYGKRIEEYRLPKGKDARRELGEIIGHRWDDTHGRRLLCGFSRLVKGNSFCGDITTCLGASILRNRRTVALAQGGRLTAYVATF
jgi:transposase